MHNNLLSEHAESQGLASNSHLASNLQMQEKYNCKTNPPQS